MSDLWFLVLTPVVWAVALLLMANVISKKVKDKSKTWFQKYWSEIMLLVSLTLSAYFFFRGLRG